MHVQECYLPEFGLSSVSITSGDKVLSLDSSGCLFLLAAKGQQKESSNTDLFPVKLSCIEVMDKEKRLLTYRSDDSDRTGEDRLLLG